MDKYKLLKMDIEARKKGLENVLDGLTDQQMEEYEPTKRFKIELNLLNKLSEKINHLDQIGENE